MLFLDEIRDYIKTLGIGDNFYIGKIDGNKEKSIGVYQRKNVSPPITAIGQLSSYEVKPVSILIHWTKNANETEKAAYELYKKLMAVSSLQIKNTHIYILSLLQSEPIDVGTDDNGVYERVIEFNLYYERND